MLLLWQDSRAGQKTDRWPRGLHLRWCIELCNEIIEEELNEDMDVDLGVSPNQGRSKTLDQYVVGQEQAKVALSVAVYNHYKRINCGMRMDDGAAKSNILLS